jgi:hypothetical protein
MTQIILLTAGFGSYWNTFSSTDLNISLILNKRIHFKSRVSDLVFISSSFKYLSRPERNINCQMFSYVRRLSVFTFTFVSQLYLPSHMYLNCQTFVCIYLHTYHTYISIVRSLSVFAFTFLSRLSDLCLCCRHIYISTIRSLSVFGFTFLSRLSDLCLYLPSHFYLDCQIFVCVCLPSHFYLDCQIFVFAFAYLSRLPWQLYLNCQIFVFTRVIALTSLSQSSIVRYLSSHVYLNCQISVQNIH